MPDIVVTVPMNFRDPFGSGKRGLAGWCAEGDCAGAEWSGDEWAFTVGGCRPCIEPGERVYVVCEYKLRGYAPLIRLDSDGSSRWALIRGGGAVALTIPDRVVGFRGWRRRWWERHIERPFPDWQEKLNAK